MSFPSGVLTATLTFSNPLTFLGNEATRTELTVQPSAGVVWAATGQPIDDFAEIITPGPGLPGQLNIPFVDQDGFTDQAGNSFKMWAYVLTRKTFFGNTVKTVKKYWQPLIGQDSTDFDNLPGGTVGLPVAVSPVPVTSVAGLTLAVGAAELVTALDPYLPAPEPITPEAIEANLPQRLEATALTAAIDTQITASPTVAEKLNSTDAATTYAPVSSAVAKPGRVIAFAGDSHTQSLGPSASRHSYVPQTCHIIGTFYASSSYIRAGVAGENSAKTLVRLPAILAQNPGALVIEAGANDASEAVTLASFANTMTTMINMGRAKGIPVIVMTVPPKAALAPSLPGARTYIDRYNIWIRLNAGRLGYAVADIAPPLTDQTTGNLNEIYRSNLDDAMHMNDLAHSLMARIVADAFRRTLRGEFPAPASAWMPMNMVANGFMNGAGTVADGWANSGTATSLALVADTTGELPGGKWQEATVTATAAQVSHAFSVTLNTADYSVGDVLALSCMMQIEDVSGHWEADASGTHTGFMSASVSNGSLVAITPSFDFTTGRKKGNVYTIGPSWGTGVVANASGMICRFAIQVPTGGRSVKMRFGAVQVLNLTRMALTANT